MYDIVTIVFREEVELLEIQAASFAKYIPRESIGRIKVVVNDAADVCELVNRAWYGPYQDLVDIIPYSEHWGYTTRVNGWENQQICKLLAAAECTSEWSISLDAKTWFIRPVSEQLLFPNNQASTGRSSISSHFESSKHYVENYFGISMPRVIGPGGVPFVFHTETVRELVNSIDNFIDFFQTACRYPTLVTEYYLYSGYVIKKYGNLEQLYTGGGYYACRNVSHDEAAQFEDMLAEAKQNTRLYTVSIHRRAYRHMTPAQIAAWVEFLDSYHIIADCSKTLGVLNTMHSKELPNGIRL